MLCNHATHFSLPLFFFYYFILLAEQLDIFVQTFFAFWSLQWVDLHNFSLNVLKYSVCEGFEAWRSFLFYFFPALLEATATHSQYVALSSIQAAGGFMFFLRNGQGYWVYFVDGW